jgi:2,5-dihydroxypyridine 5,6-dioxygenase
MLAERIEHRWIEAFAESFGRCGVAAGEAAAVLGESQSRPVLLELAELALLRLGARPVRLLVPSPPAPAVPQRSTGASRALRGHPGVLAALAACPFVADCTVEGLLHAPELPAILKAGSRVLMVSNEHPEVLERLLPRPGDDLPVKAALARLRAARRMRVTSAAGTALDVVLTGARSAGVWGWCDRPGTVAHWPGGVVVAFPAAGSVEGRLVLAPGDANLTFMRHVERPVLLTLIADHVEGIDGEGADAALFRAHLAAWDRPARAVSHVGWGLNPRARPEALALYPPGVLNGTELRCAAGNFLFSTGANEFAGRFTEGHFDLPMFGCTIELDGVAVVRDGVPVAEG